MTNQTYRPVGATRRVAPTYDNLYTIANHRDGVFLLAISYRLSAISQSALCTLH
jgi:hypothetical protein